MDAKERARRDADLTILNHLNAAGDALTVYELARRVGWSWQATARVVKRLLTTREVLLQESTRKDYAYRVRRVVRYRPAGRALVDPPAWLGLTPRPVVGARPVKFD